MRAFILCCLISLLLSLQSGCSFGPIVYVTADDINLKEPTNVRLMRSDKSPDLMEWARRDNKNIEFINQPADQINQIKVCRIKYHEQYYKNRYVVVEGEVGLQGNRYPVVLDTGASQSIFLNVSHVLDNKLSIYPMESTNSDLNGHKLGLCYLPLLQIGEITFTNRPCFYLEPPSTVSLFGMKIAGKNSNNNTVIVGLPILREFNYVMFDNIENEVEFSYNRTFEVSETSLWEKYTLSIEEDFHGNAFLFVQIPIAGEKVELQFDSGSGRGLAIGERLWGQINSKIQDLNLKKGRDFYPYIGRLACKKAVIPKFKVGDRVIQNAEISVFPDDSPLLAECEGLLGMQYFQNTIVVLDFEKSLMWVGNQ